MTTRYPVFAKHTADWTAADYDAWMARYRDIASVRETPNEVIIMEWDDEADAEVRERLDADEHVTGLAQR